MRPNNLEADKLLGLYFPVLDYGFVRLCDYMGTDKCIEEAARVSYQAGTRKISETRGLLRYLRRQSHSSPFEMIELKFHISMPIFCMRQFVRTRTANLNEISGRYSLLPMIFYTPTLDQFCKQSKSNNQGRSDEILNENLYKKTVEKWNKNRDENKALYEALTEEELAKELARIDLPLSVYTQLYWKIDLHNLFHTLSLRCDSHAQWEIREFANVIAGIVKVVAPLAYEAWIDYDFGSRRFSRMELTCLADMLRSPNLSDETMAANGLTPREIKEFKQKLEKKDIPDFSLDLKSTKSADYFERLHK
jgi:thymidylate synthase (FAD)